VGVVLRVVFSGFFFFFFLVKFDVYCVEKTQNGAVC